MRRISFLLFLFISFQLSGQVLKFKEYSLNAKFHKGFILLQNNEVAHLATQHPTMLELDAFKRTDGSKLWHKVHHYPQIGYSLNYLIMDPKKPVGNMLALVAYMSKSFFETKRSRLDLRIGFGPGYASRIFDLHKNHKNILISSHFNFCLNGRISYTLRLGKHFAISTGIGIIHLSNGTVKLPNQGINIPTMHFGIILNPKPYILPKADTIDKIKRKLNFDLMFSLGIKEAYPILKNKFIVSTVSAYCNKRLNYKSGLTLGLDYFYDPSVTRLVLEDLNFIKRSKLAVTGGHELYFGNLSLLTQLGIYLYDPYKLNVAVYERYGFKYKIGKKAFSQLTMKIFFGSVDFVEWGTGYKF